MDLLDKAEVLRLLKEDHFIRDEVKRVIRQRVLVELEPIRREIVQPLTVADILPAMFPEAVCIHALCDKVATPEDVLYVVRVGKLYKRFHPDSRLRCVLGVRGITPKASQMATAANIEVIVARQQ